MEQLIIVLGAPFLAACLHQTWFSSDLPMHVFSILSRLKLLRGVPNSFPGQDAFFDWLAITDAVSTRASELLTCPNCLKWHVSVWVAWVTTFFDGNYDFVLFKIGAGVLLCTLLVK